MTVSFPSSRRIMIKIVMSLFELRCPVCNLPPSWSLSQHASQHAELCSRPNIEAKGLIQCPHTSNWSSSLQSFIIVCTKKPNKQRTMSHIQDLNEWYSFEQSLSSCKLINIQVSDPGWGRFMTHRTSHWRCCEAGNTTMNLIFLSRVSFPPACSVHVL